MPLLHIKTPLLSSIELSKKSGQSIYLKCENLQPSGSFKIRGIGKLCQQWKALGKSHLVSSSGGNAGYSVAYAGKKLGIPVTVFVPQTTHQIFIDALRSLDAEVNVVGKVWDETNQIALQYNESIAGGFVPPFDHPTIWAGHASLVTELYKQMSIQPDLIVLAVGGGGLLCGVAEGLHQVGWQSTAILAVEPTGAASFKASVEAGELVSLSQVNTIATSLAAKKVTYRALEWAKAHRIIPALYEDTAALRACLSFADEHRMLVEPACGMALAAVYENNPALAEFKNIVVILCGGIGVSLGLLQSWQTAL
jgi:L-serine/L-threonine ammonia-lyase